jgi:hypothetical protein
MPRITEKTGAWARLASEFTEAPTAGLAGEKPSFLRGFRALFVSEHELYRGFVRACKTFGPHAWPLLA